MVDLEKVGALLLAMFTGGVLVMLTHSATMNTVRDDIEGWNALARNSQAAAAQCISVLEKVDAELLTQMGG